MLSCRVLVLVQIAGFLAALAALALYPPARGEMLLVPLTGAAATHLAPRALAGGAALVAAGPVDGSLIVSGERARLRTAFASNAVLLLAAPAALCGASPAARA